MEIYWTVVVTVFGGAWAVLSAFRDRKRQAIEDSRAIVSRLIEQDRLSIDHPEIHRYLAATALKNEEYFRAAARLRDDDFFKAKSFVYSQLNLFDEILSVSAQAGSGFFAVRSPGVLEVDDWKTYIKRVMAHPLCRSILAHEANIFGRALQDFWCTCRAQITSGPPDPFAW